MLRIDHALRSARVVKALTGLSILKFIDLTDRFAQTLAHHRGAAQSKTRQRQPGGRNVLCRPKTTGRWYPNL